MTTSQLANRRSRSFPVCRSLCAVMRGMPARSLASASAFANDCPTCSSPALLTLARLRAPGREDPPGRQARVLGLDHPPPMLGQRPLDVRSQQHLLGLAGLRQIGDLALVPVSYTHLRAHETP